MSHLTTLIPICVLLSQGVSDVDGDEVKSVMEGDSVTLHTDITEIQTDQQILWMFGPQKTRIAELYKRYNVCDPCGSFKDGLQVDDQTGSLNISNISVTNTGLYHLEIINSSGTVYKTYNVTVYARLPVPVIMRNSSQCSSSRSKCVLLCSVLNVRDVSLSWYKGNSLLSSISVSDLNIRLSLPLEVEYQDTNTYRCVLNNTITNQTKLLNIKVACQCSEYKGTHRLHLLAPVVAAVLILVAAAVIAVKCCKRNKETTENQEAETIPINKINTEPAMTEVIERPISNGVAVHNI